jgi:hypothetical protein
LKLHNLSRLLLKPQPLLLHLLVKRLPKQRKILLLKQHLRPRLQLSKRHPNLKSRLLLRTLHQHLHPNPLRRKFLLPLLHKQKHLNLLKCQSLLNRKLRMLHPHRKEQKHHRFKPEVVRLHCHRLRQNLLRQQDKRRQKKR